MTAVVGILNKQAVALAADSAVTISGSNGRKIFNKANKVFTLSKFHPIGIMIYNSASFMSTPWETIIKIYRKQLGDKSFKRVKEYQEDFINFLKSKNYFTTQEIQKEFLENISNGIIDDILNTVGNTHLDLIKDLNDDNKEKFIGFFEKKIDDILKSFVDTECCQDLIGYKFKDFKNYSNLVFENLFKKIFFDNGFNLTERLKIKLKEVIFSILKMKRDNFQYTGLIFAGFGEDEIYPQLIPVHISAVIDNKLLFYIDENSCASISNELNGAIRPFAQQDVIDTILSGVDPDLEATYLSNFGSILNKYNKEILEIIGDSNPILSTQIKSLQINVLVDVYAKMNQDIKQQKYIIPLMNAVSSLDKEDLAEMAESLIYLTYLKRRITFAEESVGGPVDVAIISKGDGFVWIKRKHYFQPELNQHFFENYFNK